MWGPLYLAVIAVALTCTWSYAVREEAVVFTSAVSAIAWSVTALESSIRVTTGAGLTELSLGPIRYVWGGLALLSFLALTGAILGQYPENRIDDKPHTNP